MSVNSKTPIAVVMISLNEGHNMESVLENIQGWAQEVFLVDSYSSDNTVDIALRFGAHVVQRRFRGFGDQWNFALEQLPIKAPWIMKLDPDERLTEELKYEIERAIADDDADGFNIQLRLWFMERPLPIQLQLVRLWRTDKCRFTDVLVNEYPQVEGKIRSLRGHIEHHDSPDLHHWYDKQNRYTTAEAVTAYKGLALSAESKLLGNTFQRRMWLKRNLFRIPFRYSILFLYNYLVLGAWRAGKVGYIWSRLRVEVYRAWDYKLMEMRITGREPIVQKRREGEPDDRVRQYKNEKIN